MINNSDNETHDVDALGVNEVIDGITESCVEEAASKRFIL